ncbi:MAG: methyltransferase [Chloroflexi bacterium]|nr:methyltransferase [Chloroflexota bacterium]
MNSKERVQAALRRQPVDRVPIFMWFHPETTAWLARWLELPPADVGEAFGNDIRQAWVSNNYAMEGIVHARDGDGHTDAWGIRWVKSGPFNQIVHSPLAAADRAKALAYEYPYDQFDALLANMEPVVNGADRFFVGCDVSPCLFEMLCRVRGMEQTLTDLAADRPLADEMLRRAARFALTLEREACGRFPLDMLWTGDDVGGQQGMVMSPRTWRELIKPHLARILAVGKARGLWVAYHSCGAIRPILADLVEIGLDILNPIQCNCPGMEPASLKREFGARLTFMGGVDTQQLLPRGTPSAVREATQALIDALTSDGGGYVLAASHTVPPETPLANILAMYEAAGLSEEQIRDQAGDIRRRHTAGAH